MNYTLSHAQLVAFVPAVQDYFTYMDLIVFVEATIYQMDEDNEKLCSRGGQEDRHILTGKQALHTSTSQFHLQSEGNSSQNASETGEKVVLEILRQKGLLDQRVTAELAKVKEQQSA